MAYEQVQKTSSSFVPVQKKVSEFAPSASRVQAKDVTAGEQEQIPKVSTPATDANWLMKHPLFKGNQFLQRVVAPASESESLESEEETLQRQEEGNEAATPYSLPVQAKLTIGEPGDKYEQEADRVASQVVKQINSPEAASSSQGQSVQRQEEPVEELQRQPSISDLQRTPLPLEVQREAMPAEEELQAKSILQGREAIAVGEATNDLDSAINSARGGGQFLDAGLQRSMGQAMGADFSGVKVHTDAQSDQLNRSIQAKAFTTGQDVFFRQGAYDPGSRGGQELIAHELTHVVQQNGGAVMRSLLEKGKEEPTVEGPAEPIQAKEAETPNKTGLSGELKAGVENLSGYSLDDVRVHYNSPKPVQLQALAYTQGTEIHVAPGQEEHIPHEAWHVVQQAQGRVKPTMQMEKGVPVNEDEGLEREADVMGAKALQRHSAAPGAVAPEATGAQREIEATEALNVPGAAISAAGDKLRLDSLSVGRVAQVVQLVRQTSINSILAKVRKIRDDKGFTTQIPVPTNRDTEAVSEWWNLLVDKFGEDLLSLSADEAASWLYEKKSEGVSGIKEKVKPPNFMTGETVFRVPPQLSDAQGNRIIGQEIKFQIKGLGEGRVALYQDLNKKSYDRTLAWMSHGLQVSDGKKTVERARSFGFVVGKNENLLRPETVGGFDSLIDSFMNKTGTQLPREENAPDILVGAHDPTVDFPKSEARKAIASMLPKCDVAILIDFVPFEHLDEEYITPEMKYLGFTYPPLNQVIQAIPSLSQYEDFLMLCCRTDITTKMQGGSGSIPDSNQVVAFNPEVEQMKGTGAKDKG